MAKKLYVGNLLHALTQQELSEVFAEWGPVTSSVIITDHATGQSRGFGFVELPDDKAADAVARMNGTPLRGRPLVVNEARPRDSRAPAGRAPGGFRGRTEPESDLETDIGYSGVYTGDGRDAPARGRWETGDASLPGEAREPGAFRSPSAGGAGWGNSRPAEGKAPRGRDKERGRKEIGPRKEMPVKKERARGKERYIDEELDWE